MMSRVRRFEIAAHSILGQHEGAARSRVYLIEQTYRAVDALSAKQTRLLHEATRCVEFGLLRSAHVMAWAALMDSLQEKLTADELKALRQIRPNWKASNLEDLREYVPESQMLDAAKELGLLSKNQAKALHGLLNKRNECAHPSGYEPGLNDTLGYVSEILSRIETLRDRRLQAPATTRLAGR